MMSMLWVVLFVALIGFHLGCGSPVRPTPQSYPHDAGNPIYTGWGGDGSMYAVVPALALVVAVVSVLFGCTWCYRHKDCKLFTASASHLHEARRSHPPDSGFSEPANNNISEDNNNGPISLREMQNIANNNATAYIVSENEERNRMSRESVVEFEPLPTGIRVVDPLERCADWFGGEDFPRDHLQYLREIGRGWFGRVVEGELEESGSSSTVAVKILNQNASLEDKARFLDEARIYRDVSHENVLAFVGKYLQEDPWILIFEFCSMDLQQYLIVNRPKMAILNEGGVPLRLMCDVTGALAHLHSRGYLYGNVWSGGVLVRGSAESARAVLGRYVLAEPHHDFTAPETTRHPPLYTGSSEVWSLGTLVWEVCAWGMTPARHPPPLPDLPCPYRNHLYQVMQLCWNPNPEGRPTAAQVQALINHLYITHTEANEPSQDDGYGSSDFEERWQRLKPNTIPKVDEHIAIIHAPSTSMTSHFTGSDQDLDNIQTIHDTLSVDMDTAVSRSSSIMSDRNPLSVQIKSESLTNLHGSLEDVRNIYLTHNETAVLECHQGNIILEESKEKEHDKSDSSLDPWLKDIMAGSHDDVSYYKDVSDVIKNLDNILNSEKTSSSESSHHASPSRDNLILDCKKDYPMQSSLVKSPGITNFQSIVETGFNSNSKEDESYAENDTDRDTIGTLSHSFERHSDTSSQHTLENLTPDTPMKDIDISIPVVTSDKMETQKDPNITVGREIKSEDQSKKIPKGNNAMASYNNVPKLKELCVVSLSSVSINVEQTKNKDCRTPCDSKITERTDIKEETKSINHIENLNNESKESDIIVRAETVEDILPNLIVQTISNTEKINEFPAIDNSDAIPGQSSSSKLERINIFESNPVVNYPEFESSNGREETVFSDLIENETYGTKNPVLKFSSDIFIEIEKGERYKEENTQPLSDAPELKKDIPIENDTWSNTLEVNKENKHRNNETSDIQSKRSNEDEEVSLTNNSEKIPEFLPIVLDENDIYKEIESKPVSAIISRDEDMEFSCISVENEHKQELLAHDTNQENDLDNSRNLTCSQNNIELNIPDNTITNESKINELKEDLYNEILIPVHKSNENAYEFLSDTVVVKPICDVDNDLDIKHVESVFTFLQEESAQNSDSENNDEINKSITELEDENKIIENIVNNSMIEMRVNEIAADDSDLPTKNSFVPNQVKVYNGEETMEAILTTNSDSLEYIVNIISPAVADSKTEVDVIRTSENAKQMQELIFDEKEPIVEEIAQLNNIENVNTCLSDATFLRKSAVEPDIVARFKEESLFDSLDAEKNLAYVAPIGIVENGNEIAISDLTEQAQSPVGPADSCFNIDFNKLESCSNNSTVYMDIMSTSNDTLRNDSVHYDIKEAIQQCLDTPSLGNISLIKNESTEYLDLPSFGILKAVDDFLHLERIHCSKDVEITFVSSTPIVSDGSTENVLENLTAEHEAQNLSETNIPDYGPGVTLTKLEQTFVPESMSPFESPTKSHQTDTFDENSSVVLGPFENCSLELFKGLKSTEFVDFPREEVLAFSSNFSEMNLETPSPLRDGNFLNEVPDIAHDDFVFDNIATISEMKAEKLQSQSFENETKAEQSEPQTETNTDESGHSVTEKHVSPSTPPNSPGVFTAVTSQQKYIVDIDLNTPTETINTLQNEIDLNQIELQITSKLAMAENENNLNIEYSGPLNVESMGEGTNDATPETFLAGSVDYRSVEELREGLTLDEECVQALRNELELKLPLAQVAAIEPACDNEWSLELPPPPELVVSYPGALSPIAEETGQQLCAYENDINWNASTRTDSSESYPEPCNNSTDEATDMPTGVHSEPRSDLRSEAHTDPRSDAPDDPGSDAHSDPHSDAHNDPHCDTQSDALNNAHSEPRNEAGSDTRNNEHSDKCNDEHSNPCNQHSDAHNNERTCEQADTCSDPHTDVHSEPHEQSTYTIHSNECSANNTYTVHKDVASSKELTMSADSLNGSHFKIVNDIAQSLVSNTACNKNEDEKESTCERISQVSPFLLSPITDTSAPENSDNFDNATGVSTLSKTTQPTDAKLSKPSECLSKATSIDSWCSNDTLYNVEENFDDLAMDPESPIDFAKEKDEAQSESTDTLTHNDDEKELSHCSTYLIHDSKSEACETFSPDSITVNDNYTYTKVKTEPTHTTPSVITKSDENDSTKNSQTKDLAYGTLMSGLPSYSNCTTEIPSAMDDIWKLPQPELVRRSPIENIDITPPKVVEDKELEDSSPQLQSAPQFKKMESVEIVCLQDSFVDNLDRIENQNQLHQINDSANVHYRTNMVPSVTSTPFIEFSDDSENIKPIPMNLPLARKENFEYRMIPNFDVFQISVEGRPQDLSSNNDPEQQNTELLLEGENKTLSEIHYKNSYVASERTPTYSDFEYSVITKQQDSRDKSSQIESGINSEEFRCFEDSVKNRPQDLSSLIDASSLFLKSERMSSDMAMYSTINDLISHSRSGMSAPMQSLNISPPNFTNLVESHDLINVREPPSNFLINFDVDDEIEQPHSIIITEAPLDVFRNSPNVTFDSHSEAKMMDGNQSYDSHINTRFTHNNGELLEHRINGEVNLDNNQSVAKNDENNLHTAIANKTEGSEKRSAQVEVAADHLNRDNEDAIVNGKSENYATVHFLSETFEELIESNVDDTDIKDNKIDEVTDLNPAEDESLVNKSLTDIAPETSKDIVIENKQPVMKVNGVPEMNNEKMSSVTDNFLQNEKKFCQLNSYFPLLNDIRFTGPATEIMSTSFTQDSPTEPMSPECEKDSKPNNTVGVLIKEWDSDSDSSNSSSGEFIWKQREGGSQSGAAQSGEKTSEGGGFSDGSGDSGSGSGSEGDEVEFVPSSWDCRAAPSKSSLRSLEQAAPDSKKRVVFKRQKYHCVYEYPREAPDADSPAPYLPDFSTYSDWDPSSVEEAELGYGQLFGGPSPLDLYPLRSGIAFGSDYDEDFFISSSARPFESLGIMSTTSQFFPGMHMKPALLERDLSDDITEEFPPPPSPLPAATLLQTRTPSLDFTTPDSGVEDITPGSTTDEEFKTKKLPETEQLTWRSLDSGSSSESVSPSSPGGEALGGLRHTRDKLKLDLPPSPHIPSPRHNRVFNFILDKPKRRSQDTSSDTPSTTPLVMTDETPVVTNSLPLQDSEDLPLPEPTFSTFGKSVQKVEPEQKIILTDDVDSQKIILTGDVESQKIILTGDVESQKIILTGDVESQKIILTGDVESQKEVALQEESAKVVEAVKGEGTVLDSGDEDSGIESSSKATLERNKTSNVS